jgi:omega-6 fatty acid desaturase (delta-12 desaturase)
MAASMRASVAAPPHPTASAWRTIVAPYQESSARKAVIQLLSTLLPLGALLYLMYRTLDLPIWVTLALGIPTAGLFIRTFIIMHDCSHGSFLASRRANDAIGFVTGVLTLMSFGKWRRDHALHHASSGDLERRGHGDVPTLTVREYRARSRWGRLKYRLIRNPFVLLGLGPFLIVLEQRLASREHRVGSRQFWNVWGANAAIVVVAGAFALLIGWRALLLVYLPAYYLAAVAGVWLFYVQHQFEGTYWQDHERWDYATAAVRGSSYLKLPAPLRWFTGNIGLHHVHHLSPRIPNYNLQRCHDENALFHDVSVVSLKQCGSVLRLALWDEDAQRLVPFAALGRGSSGPMRKAVARVGRFPR